MGSYRLSRGFAMKVKRGHNLRDWKGWKPEHSGREPPVFSRDWKWEGKSKSPEERKRCYQRYSVGIDCDTEKKYLFLTTGWRQEFWGKKELCSHLDWRNLPYARPNYQVLGPWFWTNARLKKKKKYREFLGYNHQFRNQVVVLGMFDRSLLL